MATTLKQFLADVRISQAEVARGIGRTTAFVSFLANGDTGASQDTIQALLSFLSQRLARRVTYEELFGAPVEASATDTLSVPEEFPAPAESKR
jgi:predicted transcriptional regulator